MRSELNADNAAEVKSLAGIEYFRNLKTLKVSGLESLDDSIDRVCAKAY